MIWKKDDKIYVSGHTGMVGSAVVRKLKLLGFNNLLLRTRAELDLLEVNDVKQFFYDYQPQYVIVASAKVGGIQANIANPVDFLVENLVIQNNIINQSYQNGVNKLLFLGSSCIYPKDCPQPMKEEYLLTGAIEPTHEGYALAKITGLKLLAYYRQQYGFISTSLMPCNLYGTNDSYHPEHAHVLSSLVKKFVDAKKSNQKQVTVWGTGVALREFMHVEDMADAIIYFMENYHGPDFINVGWGNEISIKELVKMISVEVGFSGEIIWDSTKPNGMMRKCMDVTRMKDAGFKPKISLEKGLRQTIREYTILAERS